MPINNNTYLTLPMIKSLLVKIYKNINMLALCNDNKSLSFSLAVIHNKILYSWLNYSLARNLRRGVPISTLIYFFSLIYLFLSIEFLRHIHLNFFLLHVFQISILVLFILYGCNKTRGSIPLKLSSLPHCKRKE